MKHLVQTVAKMSELLYAREERRTPKSILQLYNCTWLHHELCQRLTREPRHTTTNAFYGAYLHALVVHAPVQYEIVCLRSVNTENQERIFQQAKQIARSTTNRKPGNVIPNILIRMQAKQLSGSLLASLDTGESRVEKAASGAPSFSGTVIKDDFLKGCSSSWQAHMEHVSSFLVFGEGVWWERVPGGYRFFDGDKATQS